MKKSFKSEFQRNNETFAEEGRSFSEKEKVHWMLIV